MLGIAELFYSIQGEGTWTGTPAVFVRLAGCNLNCRFCDTDYALRAFASPGEIVTQVRELGGACPMVVLTGGEPLAQRESSDLIAALEATLRLHCHEPGTLAAQARDGGPQTCAPDLVGGRGITGCLGSSAWPDGCGAHVRFSLLSV